MKTIFSSLCYSTFTGFPQDFPLIWYLLLYLMNHPWADTPSSDHNYLDSRPTKVPSSSVGGLVSAAPQSSKVWRQSDWTHRHLQPSWLVCLRYIELPPLCNLIAHTHSPQLAVGLAVLAAHTAMAGTVRDISVRRREIAGIGCVVLGFVQAGFAAETGFGLTGEQRSWGHALQVTASGSTAHAQGRGTGLLLTGTLALALDRRRGVVDHGFGGQSYHLGPAVARRSVGLVIVAEIAEKKLINHNLNIFCSLKLMLFAFKFCYKIFFSHHW